MATAHEMTGDKAHQKAHADSAKRHADETKAFNKFLADQEKAQAQQAEEANAE